MYILRNNTYIRFIYRIIFIPTASLDVKDREIRADFTRRAIIEHLKNEEKYIAESEQKNKIERP